MLFTIPSKTTGPDAPVLEFDGYTRTREFGVIWATVGISILLDQLGGS